MFLIDLKAGGRGQEVGGFFTLTGYNRVGNSQEKKNLAEKNSSTVLL